MHLDVLRLTSCVSGNPYYQLQSISLTAAILEAMAEQWEQEMVLGPAAKKSRLDTSIHTSVQDVTPQGVTGTKTDTIVVAEEFGRTQGPAGEAISEDISAPDRRAGDETSDYTLSNLGVVGPSERVMDDGDLEGADAALYAADRAQKRGSSDDAVLDALEAAEAEYAATHDKPELGGKLNGRVEEALNGGPSSPRANGLPRTASGQKAGANVDEVTRQRVRERIRAALRKNACVGEDAGRAEQLAAACEEKCFHSCTSRTVYLNKAGNAARVAASLAEADLDELPRIASGEARQLHADSAAGPAAAASAAGMQGITMKPA